MQNTANPLSVGAESVMEDGAWCSGREPKSICQVKGAWNCGMSRSLHGLDTYKCEQETERNNQGL
jgi:hypothetical protein